MHLLRLFGGASLHGPHGAVTGRAAQRRRLALLALLAVEHPRAVSRDKLIGYLWPEKTTERGRHLLRDSLYILRGQLGDSAIATGGDEIRLDPVSLRCDLWDFEEALARDDLDAAVALWTGPFLDGVFIEDADEFERWVAIERGRHTRRYTAALEALAGRFEERDDPLAAADCWRRLADEDPHSTHIALRLMYALDATGNRAAALRHAMAHAQLMRAEFGAEPDPGIVALADRLRQETDYSATDGERPSSAVGTRAPADSVVEPAAAPAHWDDEGAPHVAQPTSPHARLGARPSRRVTLLGAAAAVVVGVSAFVMLRGPATPAVAPDPRRVVVVPLENRTGDPTLDVVGSIASDWITQGLAASGEVQVVTFAAALMAARHVIAGRAESLGLPRAMAAETGAGIVVLGSYFREGDSLRLQARVVDAVGGRVLAAPQPVSADPAAPLAGIDALRERVLAELATSLNPQLRFHTTGATRPPTYQAYRAYADGIARVIEADWRGAIEPLRTAASLDSAFTLPLVVLGMMHFNVREFAAADSIARIAGRSRDRLPPVDRALLDLLRAWLRQDHAAAYRAASAAAEVAPGSMATVQMAMEARRLNRPREAIRIFTTLDPTRGELRGDPFYWWELTLAYHQIGDHRAELRAARRARTLIPDNVVVRFTEIRALAALGRADELQARLDEALATPIRDWPPPDVLLRHTVQELDAHGHRAAARRLADRALSWQAARPQEAQDKQGYRRGLANMLLATEQWDRAYPLLHELHSAEPNGIGQLGELGLVAARLGRHAEARQISDSLAASQTAWSWGAPAYWRAAIAAQLDDDDAVLALLREAIARGYLRDDLHSDPAFQPLRRHRAFRALLQPAG